MLDASENLLNFIVLKNWYSLSIYLVEQVDVHLLKCVYTAELVQLVMHFIENQRLVIICSVILHDIINSISFQDIHHLDAVEKDDHTPTRTTWNVLHFVCLQGGLDRPISKNFSLIG